MFFLLYTNKFTHTHKMSDQGRKDFSDKINESVKPDSQKSTWDKTTEAVSDKYDQAASHLQPEEDKGVFQKISDSITGNNNNNRK